MATEPAAEETTLLRRQARSATVAVAGGAAATGFLALCCAGMLAVLGAALGFGALVAFSNSSSADLILFPLLFLSIGVTSHAWKRRNACACRLEETRNKNPNQE